MTIRTIWRTAAACLVALTLAACGGGGDGGNAHTINGVFSNVSGSITPDPATTAQALQVQFSAQFVGQVDPAAGTFTVPFTVTRTTGTQQVTTGQASFTLTTGQAGNGTYAGTAAVTLPAQPVGVQTFCIILTPASAWTFNGTVPATSCGTAVITAP